MIGSSCRYPDVLVACTPTASNAVASTDPVVIFEVLSAGIAGDDRTVKLAEYQALPSVRRYVMLEQDRVFAMLDMIGIENRLADLLGGPVDLIEEGTLRPRASQSVSREVVRAF